MQLEELAQETDSQHFLAPRTGTAGSARDWLVLVVSSGTSGLQNQNWPWQSETPDSKMELMIPNYLN